MAMPRSAASRPVARTTVKIPVYEQKLRTAVLKARQVVRQLSPEDLEFFGLARPRRRRKGQARKRTSLERRPLPIQISVRHALRNGMA